MEIALTIIVTAILAIGVVVFLLRKRAAHQRNRAIAECLNMIQLSAEQSRLKGLVSEIDIDPAFMKLRELAKSCPKEVMQTLQDMEDRWREIQRRVGEFNAQDTTSTLQSSVAMVQTEKLVEQIFDLAREVEKQLGDSD